MNASGDKMAFVIQCPKAGTLDKCLVWLQNVANNPDNGIRISFQTVDTSTGLPNGTQSQYRDITGTIVGGWQTPGLMTSNGTDGGTKRTVSAGELLGIVIDFVTFVASDSIAPGYLSTLVGYRSGMYVCDGSSGTYSKLLTMVPIFALLYDDGTYGVFPAGGGWPAIPTQNTFNSGSTPDEYALRFKLPYKARTLGIYQVQEFDNVCDMVLYDASSNVLDTISVDPDIRNNANGGYFCQYWPAGPYTFEANTVYRISMKPTSTSNVIRHGWQLPTSGALAGMPAGVEWYLSTRTNAGAWTDDQTQVPWLGLLVNGLEFTSSGSGGAHPFIF